MTNDAHYPISPEPEQAPDSASRMFAIIDETNKKAAAYRQEQRREEIRAAILDTLHVIKDAFTGEEKPSTEIPAEHEVYPELRILQTQIEDLQHFFSVSGALFSDEYARRVDKNCHALLEEVEGYCGKNADALHEQANIVGEFIAEVLLEARRNIYGVSLATCVKAYGALDILRFIITH